MALIVISCPKTREAAMMFYCNPEQPKGVILADHDAL